MAMAQYAVLGWGSLIWDLDDLADRVEGPWRIGAGPRMPMEFTRISPKRLQSLVVVLDPDHGVPCPTHAIASRAASVTEATDDLARRERCGAERIGAVCLGTGHTRGSRPEVVEAVAGWCEAGGWRGAVWTDLRPNFTETTGHPFSVTGGIGYLRGLTGAGHAESVRYISSAPPTTDTPLRRALEREEWWRAAVGARTAGP